MEDRLPRYPGRVTLTPVAGLENTFDMAMADEPTIDGTPLNKATLLQDKTCDILGLTTAATPNDAFEALAIGVGKYGFNLTVSFASGAPVANKLITGLTSLNGGTVTTDSAGKCFGVSSSASPSISISFSEYIDVNTYSGTLTATGKITDATVAINSIAATSKTISTSGSYKFSPNVLDFDAAAVGGGGGSSGYPTSPKGGAGGGGGNITNLYDQTYSDTMTVIIGAGGEVGSDGGTTTITELNLSATGGGAGQNVNSTASPEKGGSSINGGEGGNGAYTWSDHIDATAGGDRTAYPFGDSSIACSGGGGGGERQVDIGYIGKAGGSSYGGKGGDGVPPSGGASTNGEDGKGYGGGGGGAGYGTSGYGKRGIGSGGCVFFRWRYKNT